MKIDQAAPDFELPDLDGKMHTLSEYRGNIVIVNFWSCECPHSERADSLMMKSLETWGREVVLLSIAANRNESAQSV
jgi:peroxiredoxin